MQRSWFWRFPALLAVLALVLAACGSDEEEGAPGGGGEPTKTVKIGLIAPLSGSLSSLGLGIRNSVELAIRQANEQNKVRGWRIELAAEDDTAKADVGAQAATKLASDQSVAGVVGTLNSSVALQVQPILAREDIVMVSPANTATELTLGTDLENPKRQFDNYFRVSANDVAQGTFQAEFASKDLKAKKVVTIHDKKAYGQGLVFHFTNHFKMLGGEIVGSETINPGDQDFSAVLTKIRPLNPDLVFYGGEYPEAQLLTAQAKAAGIRGPLLAGDGVYDKTYIDTAKEAAEGDYVTSVGAPASELESAAKFISDYEAAGFNDDFAAYGPYSYDAANVIINAMAEVLPDEDSITPEVRKKIVDEVAKTDFQGATGKVAFDQFGDTRTQILSAYKVENQEWKPVKTETLK